MWEFLLQLLLAHMLADFAFQPSKWVEEKRQHKLRSGYLYFHIAVHLLALLVLLNAAVFQYWIGVTVLIFSHWLIDVAKLYLEAKESKGKKVPKLWFVFDQIAHVFVILLVCFCYYEEQFYWQGFGDFLLSPQALLLYSCLCCSIFVIPVFFKMFFQVWTEEIAEPAYDKKSLTNAGMWIGILERLFVFAFIVWGQWVGIGFLLTAKSVFRFRDLSKAQDRKLTEYMLIGTLCSFGVAILLAKFYLFLLPKVTAP